MSSEGLWIASYVALDRHPKVVRGARRLPLDKLNMRAAARSLMQGFLHATWHWAVTYAPDGFIEAEDADLITDEIGWSESPAEYMALLVDVGFLDEVDGGWLIHDWEEYGGKAIEAIRKARAWGEKGNHVKYQHPFPLEGCPQCTHAREGHDGKFDLCPICASLVPDSGGDSGGDTGTDSGAEPGADSGNSRGPLAHNTTKQDTREDQVPRARTREELPLDIEPPERHQPNNDESPQPKKASKRKRAHALPDDWQPNDTHQRIAREEGRAVDREAQKFRDWAAANGATKVDWDRAFCNWLRSDIGRSNRPPDGRLTGTRGGVQG